MINVLKLDKLDLSNIDIEEPERISNYFYSKIKYGDEPLYIQTPKIINSKCMKDFDTKDPYIEVEVDYNIYDIFCNFDDKILSCTSKNWEKWMNKKIPIEIFEKMYIKMTNGSTKTDETQKLKFKLPISRSKLLTKVFDENKIDCDINELMKNIKIICILNIKGIKFNEKTFRCDSYITQIKIFKNQHKENIIEQCLIDTEEESIDENDIIDKQELEELLKLDKIKMLINQKREEQRLIQQINQRIQNISDEIKELENTT